MEASEEISTKLTEVQTDAPRPKKKKYEQKFSPSWGRDPAFKSWLVEKKDKAFCKTCNQFLVITAKNDLVKHANTSKHKSNQDSIRFEKCRVCLKQHDVKFMREIRDTDEVAKIAIFKKINICAGVEIVLNTSPDKICPECQETLQTSYQFRILCQSSEKLLNRCNNSFSMRTSENIKNPEAEVATTFEIKPDPLYIDDVIVKKEPEVTEISHFTKNEPQFEEERRLEIIENDEEMQYDDHFDAYVDSPLSQNDEFHPEMIVEPSEKFEFNDKKSPKSEIAEPLFKKIEWEVIRKEEDPQLRKKEFICHMCGNVYQKNCKLQAHIRRHLNIKLFKCEICEKRFAQSSDLNCHMRTHTGDKPFICVFCGRPFADRSSKIRHERVHKNERPFECDECDMKFSYATTLKKHKRAHSGIKPHKCEPCGKAFAEMYQLKCHLATKIHHQKIQNMKII